MVNCLDGDAKVHLTPAQIAEIEAAARAAWPSEACGLLIGEPCEDGGVLVKRVKVMANTLAGAADDRFEIAPAALLAAHKAARAAGEVIVGHFHSHPGGRAWPSVTDAASAEEPGVIWLIQALDAAATGPLRAFRANGCEGAAPAFTPLAIAVAAQ